MKATLAAVLLTLACNAPPDTAACAAAADAGHCAIAKHALVCRAGGCVTDEDVCPNLSADAGCVNQCEPDEVAAFCGGPPPATGDPPSSLDCRMLTGLPSGAIFYCCRCAK